MEIEAEANVEITVAYSECEIKKALSFYILRICDLRTYALITYPILVAAIVISLAFNYYPLLSLVFLLIGVVLFYLYYQWPITRYLRYFEKRKESNYHFDYEKIIIARKEVQSECLWSVFKKAYEIPSAFLLLDEIKFVYVLPKTCFTSTSELEQMRDMLSKKFSGFVVRFEDIR